MLRRSGHQSKLTWSFAVIVTVSFLVTFFILFSSLSDRAGKDTRRNLVEMAQGIRNQLDAELTGMDRIAMGMLGSKEFVDGMVQLSISSHGAGSRVTFLKYEFQKLFDKLVIALNTPLLTTPMISAFNEERGYYFGWSIEGLDRPFISRALGTIPWVGEVAALRGAKALLPPRQNEWVGRKDRVFSVARAVMTTKNQYLGVLEVQQKGSILSTICASSVDATITVVLDRQGRLIYPFTPLGYEAELLEATEDKPVGALSLKQLEDDYLYASSFSEYSGWTTLVMRPGRLVFHTAALAFRLVFLSLVMVLLLALLSVVIISRRLSAPIRSLRASVEKVDAASPALVHEAVDTNDEVSLLRRSFEGLLDRIDVINRQKVQAQQDEADAYLLALQSQMNPHFLYNTLNTITALAEENGQELIVSVSRQLVSMLRYVGDYKRTKVTLREEVTCCEQYLSLLKSRYEDELTYSIEATGDLELCRVPKLILQPLAENSYKHGLSAVSPPWEIIVQVHAEKNDCFEMAVTDNGGGFSREAMDSIQENVRMLNASSNPAASIRSIGKANIGLFSTYSRLFLEYGSSVHLTIRNNAVAGCTLTLSVSAQTEPEESLP